MRDRRRRRVRTGLLLIGGGTLAVAGWLGYRYHGPTPPVQIYHGLTYGCDRLPDAPDGGNGGGSLVHWVRADLTVPGVGLYVTPMDATALVTGWEYKLRYVSTAVVDDHLAAAVNGTLFRSDSWWVRLSGDRANSIETAVSDRAVNHVDPNSYLMWWDADRLAHLELTKPPTAGVLGRSVWAIGGQQDVVVDGAVLPWIGPGRTDHRTAVGADPGRRLVWLACFDRADYRAAGRELVRLGATIGTLVDGGTSTAMALGGDARGVRPGTVTGNWRPVAVEFGFRADPLPP